MEKLTRLQRVEVGTTDTGVMLAKQIVDGEQKYFDEPHRFRLLPDYDFGEQIARVNAHLVSMGFPQISAIDIERIAAIVDGGRVAPKGTPRERGDGVGKVFQTEKELLKAIDAANARTAEAKAELEAAAIAHRTFEREIAALKLELTDTRSALDSEQANVIKQAEDIKALRSALDSEQANVIKQAEDIKALRSALGVTQSELAALQKQSA